VYSQFASCSALIRRRPGAVHGVWFLHISTTTGIRSVHVPSPMCSLSHLYDQKHIYFLTVRYQASSAAAWEPLVLFYYKHGSSVLLSDGFIVGSARVRRRVDIPLTPIRAVNDVHTILLYSILGQSQRRHPQMELRPRAPTRGDYMTNNVPGLALLTFA
jgi:hypothetical protein